MATSYEHKILFTDSAGSNYTRFANKNAKRVVKRSKNENNCAASSNQSIDRSIDQQRME